MIWIQALFILMNFRCSEMNRDWRYAFLRFVLFCNIKYIIFSICTRVEWQFIGLQSSKFISFGSWNGYFHWAAIMRCKGKEIKKIYWTFLLAAILITNIVRVYFRIQLSSFMLYYKYKFSFLLSMKCILWKVSRAMLTILEY